ncbi:MAG: ABC transporter ATP-binding protein [Nitrospirae bacterium]|nr:ABC transporter ATP-binding protein [Nitrospirota bacterium]
MPLIEIKGLTKVYGGLTAVDGLDLTIGAGEIFGFLGPNGAGKTTTLKMMAGLIRPTSGSVSLDGHDVATEPLAAKAILGFVPDRPFVYEKLTATEFMAFIGGLYSMDPAVTAPRSVELLSLFGLASWSGELVEGFSHGMRQRLVMAAALLHRPKILVVDEPMVGLDPKGVRLLREVFLGLKAEGSAVFMSTHSLDLAEKIADRVGIINRGKLIALGSVEEMRGMADMPGSALDEVFLKLTEERAEVS